VKAFTTLMCGALVLLAAALLVPQALGAVRPDDRAGPLGAGAVVTAQVVRPDDRAGPLGTGAVALAGQPLYWQGERDYGAYTPGGDIVAPAVVPRVASPSGWEWNDAWFGAMVVVGLALVAAAIAFTTHEHRGHRPIPH
jgi:hypothetical protein